MFKLFTVVNEENFIINTDKKEYENSLNDRLKKWKNEYRNTHEGLYVGRSTVTKDSFNVFYSFISFRYCVIETYHLKGILKDAGNDCSKLTLQLVRNNGIYFAYRVLIPIITLLIGIFVHLVAISSFRGLSDVLPVIGHWDIFAHDVIFYNTGRSGSILNLMNAFLELLAVFMIIYPFRISFSSSNTEWEIECAEKCINLFKQKMNLSSD